MDKFYNRVGYLCLGVNLGVAPMILLLPTLGIVSLVAGVAGSLYLILVYANE